VDSPAPISQRLASRLLPFCAVFAEDLRQAVRHWAFISWGVLGFALTTAWVVTVHGQSPAPPPTAPAAHVAEEAAENAAPASTDAMWERHQGATGGPESPFADPALPAAPQAASVVGSKWTAAKLVGKLLALNIIVWASFVIAIGATAVSAEADVASDSILCRGVSRWQYYLAKCCARVLAVIGLFLLLTIPSAILIAYRLPNDLSFGGTWLAVKTVAYVLAGLTVLSFAGGVWFQNPMIGVAVVWMGLYGVGLVAAILEIRDLSPGVFAEKIPAMLVSAPSAAAASSQHVLPTVLATAAFFATAVSITYYSTRDV
jgi:hypothetical protein